MRSAAVTVVALLVISGVGVLDLTTGTQVSLSLVYVAMVAWAAWRGGYLAAFLGGVVAAGWWLHADLAQSPTNVLALSLWNAATRLTIFLAIGLFVRRLHDVQRDLREANDKLSDRLAFESRVARTDMLTGLKNRAGFLETLERELARSNRAGTPFGVLYLDLDNFKRINDEHGHATGDRVLKKVAVAIRRAVRITDVPARLGGDEFAVYCWNIGPTAIEDLAERLVECIRAIAAEYPGSDLGASVGVAWFGHPPPSESDVLARADAAMYAAKRSGKNRFRVINGDNLGSPRGGKGRLRAV